MDHSSLTFLESGSHLLSQSSPQFYPNTGPGGDDLSLSELSLSDRPFQPPFSLLARPTTHEPSSPAHEEGDGLSYDFEGDVLGDSHQDGTDPEKAKRLAARLREEKLQSDAFILKKLNASFALFNEALSKTESANEVRNFSNQLLISNLIGRHQCLAARLEQTDALLTKYVNILSRSEQTARLILDEKWMGADDVSCKKKNAHIGAPGLICMGLRCRTTKHSNRSVTRPSRKHVVRQRSVCVPHSKRRNSVNVKRGKRPNAKRRSGSKGRGRRALRREVVSEAFGEPVPPCGAREDRRGERVRLTTAGYFHSSLRPLCSSRCRTSPKRCGSSPFRVQKIGFWPPIWTSNSDSSGELISFVSLCESYECHASSPAFLVIRHRMIGLGM